MCIRDSSRVRERLRRRRNRHAQSDEKTPRETRIHDEKHVEESRRKVVRAEVREDVV